MTALPPKTELTPTASLSPKTARPSKASLNFDPLRFCQPPEDSEGDRRSMIEQAAYLRAEQRGFEPGHEVEDWLAAEAEINARLAR